VVGAVVDSVSDVLELDNKQIKAAPEFNSLLDAGLHHGPGHGGVRRRRAGC